MGGKLYAIGGIRGSTILTTNEVFKPSTGKWAAKAPLPLSKSQAEYTNVLAKRYSGKDVVVYFVATDSTNAKSKNYATNGDIERFVAGSKLAVPVLRDSDGAVTVKKFNVDQLPSFIILDKQGNVTGSAFGGIDPKFDITIPISKAVDRLL